MSYESQQIIENQDKLAYTMANELYKSRFMTAAFALWGYVLWYVNNTVTNPL